MSEEHSTKKERKSMAATLGRSGGLSVVRKYGKSHMSALGTKGAMSRWGDHKRSSKK